MPCLKPITPFLFQLKYEREKVSDQLAELEMKHQGLQELMETLQDGKGAAKVAEWHAKMQDTRLQHLKLSRQIGRLQEQVRIIIIILIDQNQQRMSCHLQ